MQKKEEPIQLLPSMRKECFARFLIEFAEYLGVKAKTTLVIVDGAGSHQANVLKAGSCLRVENCRSIRRN